MENSPASDPVLDAVPLLVRKTTAWAWRLLVIGAALVAVIWVVAQVQLIVVSVAISIILTALFVPQVDRLTRWGVPRGLSVALVLVISGALLGGVLTFVVTQLIAGLPELSGQVTRSIAALTDWLTEGPLGLSREQIDSAANAAISAITDNQTRLTTGAISTATTVTQIVTATFLILFTVIFLLYGGRGIWAYVTQIIPETARERVREAGKTGFGSLTGFVRATFLVALVDAVGIGVGLAIMGVPLALPLASLVFLGAFIPVVGAVVTGFLAVVVALLSKGFLIAALTLALVLAVQQLEGNVLQPFIMGRAVRLHPLAVLLAITAGAVLAGIIGALLAVPLLAFINSAGKRLLTGDDPDDPGDGVDTEAEDAEPAPESETEPSA
ncbi:AI-2E family transporter [Mycolicibacterium duvalii]|uniref:AI-2E family transporter n=1 Tax=Mycolicibacterium duvalii TaxID=39688 RepID=A0A7I7K603_9MYCO|nr:AI-2E family transporter [Mycolicibacterium duvalii]MCV7369167.1 AI-2E family transporter [Mycolicibacterium duvalii]PEG44185.1 AI-2E family transporter [Mycolicibacterium duvalii]BBX18929.1 AI-2E family transporter [Mycolicibacterium duvalii]